jgi:uncharacterized membrane protein affecting hemolysin expression
MLLLSLAIGVVLARTLLAGQAHALAAIALPADRQQVVPEDEESEKKD